MRGLYLACYDVCHPRRLRQALRLTRPYRQGGQKSVHELRLADSECRALVRDMTALLDASCDRFMLLRLDLRSPILNLGPGGLRDAVIGFYVA